MLSGCVQKKTFPVLFGYMPTGEGQTVAKTTASGYETIAVTSSRAKMKVAAWHI